MNRSNPLWDSISLLAGGVLLIFALVHKAWQFPLLVGAFVIWGGWLLLTFRVPVWRAQRDYMVRKQQTQRAQEEVEEAGVTDSAVGHTLLRHVNHRISALLKSAYPEARWEWTAANPPASGDPGRHWPHPGLRYPGI